MAPFISQAAFSSRHYVHFHQFGGLAFEGMLVFLLEARIRRRCAKHSEAAPASASSERAAGEALLKVRKSYIPETASRGTGENVIVNRLNLCYNIPTSVRIEKGAIWMKIFWKAGRKVFAVFMTVSLISAALPVFVNGSQSKEQQKKEQKGEENSWRYKNGTPTYAGQPLSRAAGAYSNAWNKVNGMYVNNLGNPIPGAVKKGIDVSQHQSRIDWEKVKASGIDFAVIRCANSTYDEDTQWKYNVAECERLNISYGVYIFSQAQNTVQAQAEAKFTAQLLNGHKPTYPIYMDLEANSISNLSKNQYSKNAEAFKNILKTSGYSNVGIYANSSWWRNKLTSSAFNKYSKWVAQWATTCNYDGNYHMWQCTSSGKVNGINGNVDLNFLIKNIPAKSIKLSKKSLSLKKGSSYTLKSYIEPKNSYPGVKWSSSSSSVASVSSSGKITAKKVGTAVITGRTGNGKKASCKVTVTPKTNKIKKLKKSGAKGIKITWSKVSGVSKYQIYMSKKKASGYKRIATVSGKKASYTKGKLKKKKRYYFKVRSYQTVKKKKIYSKFSAVKSLRR